MTEDRKKKDTIVFLNAMIPSSGLKRLFIINVKHTGKFEKSSIEVIDIHLVDLIRFTILVS